MYDIIIVGAGPAGLTAALYALRANKKVLIFESKCYGGQIINASKIENYPGISNISGFDYATILYKQVMELGGEIKYETVTNITKDKIITTNKDSYKTKAIIIATGRENRKIDLENESKYIGKGISYCATCDGNFYKDKIVAVIGGGNTALTDTIYLSDIAKEVYLIHRNNVFRGDIKYIEELKKKSNVKIIMDSNIVKINGDNVLTDIDIIDKNNKKDNIVIDGLFIAIGQIPKNDSFANIIKTNDYGYIESINDVCTNVKGIYVAGDIREKSLRQLVTAVSDGAIAASLAIEEMRD